MVKIAIIGTGNWGKNHVRIFSELENAGLHTCCDLNPAALKNIREKYPAVNVTTDLDEVLKNREIDGVVVASSAVTHYEVAKKALNSGKHVFVEKPLCLSEKDALELIKISEKSGLKLMVGHLLLYHPAVRLMKNIIETNELGELFYAYTQRLNLGVVRHEENALWSLSPHDISVLLYLFGEGAQSVSCHGGAYLQKGVEDVVFLELGFKSGRTGHVHASWLDPGKVRKVTAVGSRKMLVFDDMEPSEKVRIYDRGADRAGDGLKITLRNGGYEAQKTENTEALKTECSHFINCIEKGEKPFTDGYNGLEVVRVLCAAEKSLGNAGIPERIRR